MNAEERYRNEAHILTRERDEALAEVEQLRSTLEHTEARRVGAEREVERLRDLLAKSRNKCKVALRSARDNAAGRRHAEAEVERLRANAVMDERRLRYYADEVERLRARYESKDRTWREANDEVGRLRQTVQLYSKMGTPVEAWERVKRAEAEVERLRNGSANYQRAEKAEAEAERLRAALERLRPDSPDYVTDKEERTRIARAALAKEEE